MRKCSLDNIFDDKTFLIFDKGDPACDKLSDGAERAYFVEKDTGRICFLNRYMTESEEKKAQEGERRTFRYMLLFLLSVMVLVHSLAPTLHTIDSSCANIFFLFGATVLLLPVFLFANKKGEKMLYEDYKRTAKNCPLTFIVATEKVLERILDRRRLAFLIFLIPFFGTIWLGYRFIITTEMRLVFAVPLGAAISFSLALTIKDRWRGWKLAEKMYVQMQKEKP